MTKADELNLTNLMDNLRKSDKLMAESARSEDVKNIRRFAIDALADFHDTQKKIAKLINENRDLWKNPHITLTSDRNMSDCDYRHDIPLETGVFYIGEYLKGRIQVSVKNIDGVKRADGYCRAWKDHIFDAKDWEAVSVDVADDSNSTTKDLVGFTFTRAGSTETGHLTEENLKTIEWSALDMWANIKKMAELTRVRTQTLVEDFKKALQARIDGNTKKLNELSKRGQGVYMKVMF